VENWPVNSICFRNGIERQVTDTIDARIQRALTLLNLNEFKKRHVKSFVVFGFDLYSIGYIGSRFGGHIGVPANYFYESPMEIEKSSVIYNGEPIKWASRAGELLEEALVVNEDEQVFGIAREILMLDTSKVVVQSIHGPACFLIAYTMANQINQRLKYISKPIGVSIFFGYSKKCFYAEFMLFLVPSDYVCNGFDILLRALFHVDRFHHCLLRNLDR
jgi:hypothetical protein